MKISLINHTVDLIFYPILKILKLKNILFIAFLILTLYLTLPNTVLANQFTNLRIYPNHTNENSMTPYNGRLYLSGILEFSGIESPDATPPISIKKFKIRIDGELNRADIHAIGFVEGTFTRPIPSYLSHQGQPGRFYFKKDIQKLRRLDNYLNQADKFILRATCNYLSDKKNIDDLFEKLFQMSNGEKTRRFWKSSRNKALTRSYARNCLNGLPGSQFEFKLVKDSSKSIANKVNSNSRETSCHSSSELKKIQNWLMQIGLYQGTADGVWGPVTKKAIGDFEKSLTGQWALRDKNSNCLGISERTALKFRAETKLKTERYQQKLKADAERKARLEMECRAEQLDKCSEEDICKKATVLSEGLRRWDLDKVDFWQRAVELDLDCDIKVDKTPYSKSEAQNLLTQLVEYVQNNSEYFDINFAVEFNKIRPIIEGEWTKDLSDSFEEFRQYLTKYPQFTAYLEEKRKKAAEVIAQKISKLQSELDKIIEILRDWGLKNILDEKAAEIYDLSESVKGDMYKTINGLEQLLSESQKLLNAINIKED